jgi:SAM-dependent methyltransferase
VTDLTGHPDRLRWNARYGGGFSPSFAAPPLAVLALSAGLPDGPVLDLASGPSGTVLLAAGLGRKATAVDISERALGLLGEEAARRGLAGLITLVQADLRAWQPQPGGFALVLCTGYWDREAFGPAAAAVAAGGLLGWEAFTVGARTERPRLPPQWCLGPGEPAGLLPDSFDVLGQWDLPEGPAAIRRRLLARRRAAGPAAGRPAGQASASTSRAARAPEASAP